MKYTLTNNRIISIPDAELEKLQNTLKISKDEAIDLWLSDNDYTTDETVEELSKKAKKNHITGTIHSAKSANNEKKERKPREKKENLLKKQIIAAIFNGIVTELDENAVIDVTNDEKYIDLCIDGKNFTINLVQHREKRK